MAIRMRSLLRYNSIGFKIFFSMVLLILVSMFFIVFAIYSTYSDYMRQNEIRYNILATNNIQSKFDLTIEYIQSTAGTLAGNQAVLHSLNGTPKPRHMQSELRGFIDNILVMQPFMDDVHILREDGVGFSSRPQADWGDIGEDYAEFWEDAALPANSGGFWATRGITLSYLYPVMDSQSRQIQGLLAMDISYDHLREMFMISATQLNEKVLVADSNGDILFNYPHYTAFEPFLRQYPNLLDSEFVQEEGEVYGVDSVVVSEKLRLADWRIIRIIQTEQVTSQTSQVIQTIQEVGIFLLLSCLVYSLWITHVIVSPVRALDDACTQAEQGNLDVRVKISTNDEFGKLGKTFNMMLQQLQRHLKREIASEKRKSEMQFQILQAQINPHFLYNTLDSMRWLAVMKNVHSIAEMSSSLINLLKYNLASNVSTTTLRDELESVRNYITIQKFRYSDNFDFSMKVDDHALDCEVVRFLLQPLVENSIIHGFEDVSEGYSIRVAAFFADGKLHIKVIDNGVGMNPEQIEVVNSSRTMKHRFNNIGVANIRERVKLHFGEEYDLYYSSEPYIGTIAELVLPVIYPGDRPPTEENTTQ